MITDNNSLYYWIVYLEAVEGVKKLRVYATVDHLQWAAEWGSCAPGDWAWAGPAHNTQL